MKSRGDFIRIILSFSSSPDFSTKNVRICDKYVSIWCHGGDHSKWSNLCISLCDCTTYSYTVTNIILNIYIYSDIKMGRTKPLDWDDQTAQVMCWDYPRFKKFKSSSDMSRTGLGWQGTDWYSHKQSENSHGPKSVKILVEKKHSLFILSNIIRLFCYWVVQLCIGDVPQAKLRDEGKSSAHSDCPDPQGLKGLSVPRPSFVAAWPIWHVAAIFNAVACGRQVR